jgi:hypothetical protein
MTFPAKGNRLGWDGYSGSEPSSKIGATHGHRMVQVVEPNLIRSQRRSSRGIALFLMEHHCMLPVSDQSGELFGCCHINPRVRVRRVNGPA